MKQTINHITRFTIALLLSVSGFVRLQAQTAPGTQITNSATLTFGYSDGQRDSVVSNVTTQIVQGVGRLSLDKTAFPSLVPAGNTVAFSIVVANTGTDSLQNVVVTDTLSSSLTFVSSTHGSHAAGIVTWTIPVLRVNQADTLVIRAAVKSGVQNGTAIGNKAFAVEPGGSPVSDTALVTVGIPAAPSMAMGKIASMDSVVAGTAFRYTVWMQNTGNVTLTNVVVKDTLSKYLDLIGVTGGATVRANLLTLRRDSLTAGQRDSMVITASVKGTTPAGTHIYNVARATSNQTPIDSAATTVTSKPLPSSLPCVIHLEVKPNFVIGNGIQAAVITAYMTDTLGVPKPDGTPVFFKTSFGYYSNGLDSLVTYTKGGYAVDSIRAIISSPDLYTALATISVRDSNVCSRFDTLRIVFYPGAIAGVVVNDDNDMPVKDAQVVVKNSAGVVVGERSTPEDGSFLVPVPRTDDYTVEITNPNSLGQLITVSSRVRVAVPGVGGLPPVLNPNIVSGTLYYLLSKQPIAIPNIKMYLYQLSTAVLGPQAAPGLMEGGAKSARMILDSAVTDSRGVYVIRNIDPGIYSVESADPGIPAKRTVHVGGNGYYVINSNSPVVLNPNITLAKTGPATASTIDTVSYDITFGNSGTLSLSNTVITDTLDRAMVFVGASDGGIYTSASHTIRWAIGKFDSLSTRTLHVRVAFKDTAVGTVTVTNKAGMTAAEIVPILAQTPTQLFKALPAFAVTKTASKDTVELNGMFQYTISVRNAGNVKLTNAVVIDTIRSDFFTILAVSPNASFVDSVVTWKRDSLMVNGSDSIVVTVRVKSDARDGEPVLNVVYARASELGQKIYSAQALVVVRPKNTGPGITPNLSITKSVNADTVLVGSAVRYKIRFQNTGNVSLHNVRMQDTVVSALTVQSVSSNATVAGNVVSFSRDSMRVGEIDSIEVVANLAVALPNKMRITNTAYVGSLEVGWKPAQALFVTRVVIPDKSCRIALTVSPLLVIGNGIQASRIEALVTDTLGHPKPDGTPVTFRTQVGFFSNNRDSIVVLTSGGKAIDSLRAVISNTGITTARAVISVSDADICNASSFVDIVFYPGAIAGVVIDDRTGLAVKDALVRVIASDGTVICSDRTPADGSYLCPVPKTDTYRVEISVTDNFGQPLTTPTFVEVAVPGIGGLPPVMNKNLVSGRVYYLVSNKPVYARNIQVRLEPADGTGSVKLGKRSDLTSVPNHIDSTMTDSTGTFTFYNVATGNHRVIITNPGLSGNRPIATINAGTYIINANIPILLNPNIHFVKTGPASAYVKDTVTYTITVENTGNLSSDNTVVHDSLEAGMVFVSSTATPSLAVVPPVSPTIDPTNRVLTWNVGKLDSFAVTPVRNKWTFTVTVRFEDSITTARTLHNTAIMHSDGVAETTYVVPTNVDPVQLRIRKTAMRKVLEVGDIATYTIAITNSAPYLTMKPVVVVDSIPFGFSYLANSSFRDSAKLAEPAGAKSNVLTWAVADSILPNTTITFTYRLVVGAGGMNGSGVNSAYAYAFSPSGKLIQSPVAYERVEVRPGIFSDHGLVIGKVFYDDNRNRYQDPDEVGVKGVELMTEEGIRIVTGDDGKYSIPDVLPGEHVIRLRKHTLPANSALEVGYNDFAGDAASRFVYVTPAGLARADFYLAPIKPDSLVLTQSIAKVGDVTMRRVTMPKNVVFIEDERLAPMTLSGVNFDIAKASLRPEAYLTLRQLTATLRDYPDVPLTIVGHTDTNAIKTREFPSNMELSQARANSVRNYLVYEEGIDSNRIFTRGFGEFRPVAMNKTREGRALNRRVEFFFGNRIDMETRQTQTVLFKVPITYAGSANVSRLQFTDELDARLHYVAGSAILGDSTRIEPKIDGNKLLWTITNIGTSYANTLMYRAEISMPDERVISLPSQTSNIHYFVGDSLAAGSDSLVAGSDTCRTENQAALAKKGKAVNFVLSGVLFDVAKATLRSTAGSALQLAVEELKKDPTATAIIEGHTDSSPIRTKEFPSNMELSDARANTVLDKIAKEWGIERSRLEAVGYGEYRPMASNQTADGRQQNRRVEIRIFRKNFVQAAIQEGFVDSSNFAHYHVIPMDNVMKADSLVSAESGDQFLIKLEVRRPVNGKTAEAVLVDSLPAFARIVEGTVSARRGIDTLRHGRVIEARLAPGAGVATVTFVVELTAPTDVRTIAAHKFFVRRVEKHGEILIDEAKPILLEMRKRNP